MRTGLKILLMMSLGVVVASAFASRKAETPDSGVLLELFTSHGCYSCPAADAVIHRLDKESENVVALEFHVDYWDQLVWGMDGSWKDPYSQAAFTQRQRDYHSKSLGGRKGVYTPQVVVDGQRVDVGSKERSVRKHMATVDDDSVSIHWQQDGDLLVAAIMGEVPKDANVWVARFIEEATTEITGGENAGKVLTNHNIVTHVQPVPNRNIVVVQPEKMEGKGCALVVQAANLGKVLAASYCPTS